MQPVNRFVFKVGDQEVPLISLRYEAGIDSPCGSFHGSIFCQNPFGEEISVYDLKTNPKALVGNKATIDIAGRSIAVMIEALDFSPRNAVQIAGRDRLSIVVDSSATNVSFEPKQELLSLAQKLCNEVDVAVSSEIKESMLVENMTVSPGETIFNTLEIAAAKHNVFFVSDDGESLKIIRKRSSDEIINHFSPILDMPVKFDISERFGTYELITTLKPTPNEEASDTSDWFHIAKPKQKKKEVKIQQSYDASINPKKKKILTASDLPSVEEESRRLEWENQVRQMKSISIGITLAGIKWYEIGSLIQIDLPARQLDLPGSFSYELPPISGSFLIKSRVFSRENDGTNESETTTIELIPEYLRAKQTTQKTIGKPTPQIQSNSNPWFDRPGER